MKNIKTYLAGSIQLDNGKVIVGDPSYQDLESVCVIDDVLEGTYNCYATKADEYLWGRRVISLEIKHIDHLDDSDYEELDSIPVDSAKAGIYDFDFRIGKFSDESRSTWLDGLYTLLYGYDIEGNIIFDEDTFTGEERRFTGEERRFAVVDNKAVVSSSGIGDGCYPVDVVRDGDKVVCIKITYLE